MHYPRKRFGQHFLRDQAIISQIVAALNPRANDHLIEIGPGQGALTIPVLKQVKELEAIELDRDLIHELEMRAKHAGKLTVYHEDALQFDFKQIKKNARPLRVFGNLPYNISTPLIFHLLTFTHDIHDMLFMLQKEVAERLSAETGSDHYGRLSVMVQYHCKVELLFDVPPSAFFPEPKVNSSIVRLIPYQTLPYQTPDYALFEKIVKQAFNQRRKTLRNSLKQLIDDHEWEHIPIRSDLRAENVSVKEFVEMTRVLLVNKGTT